MATSRSSAGGKFITYRRKQRIAATPYDRPPPPKSPNWFAGVVVPSALAIASGAGKILSSIFSDSDSDSSEEYDSEDDIVNDDLHEIPYNRENTLNKENVTSSEMVQYKPESQFSVWRSITKKIIGLLIMKETFSREECNTLIQILNSRVMDQNWSMDAGEKSFVDVSHGEKLQHDVDIFGKAVQEAKRWFQDKKAGLSSSVTELAQGSSNLNSETVEHNRRSFASGLWDIQEELRRVRSRETEDILRSPSTETDPSHVAVAQIRMRSPVAGEELLAMGERITEPQSSSLHNPIDAWVHSGVSSLADVRRWHEESDKENNNEDRGTAGKLEHLHFSKVNCSLLPEVAEFGGRRGGANDPSSSQVSLSRGVAKHDDDALMQVSVVSETSSMASGARNNFGVKYGERSLDISVTSPVQKHGIAGGKQQGRKKSVHNRKGRGRGK